MADESPAVITAVRTAIPEQLASTRDEDGRAWVPHRAVALPTGVARADSLAGLAIQHREAATGLGHQAALRCLQAADVAPERIDLIVTVCSTFLMIPSLDTYLANQLGLRPDVRRLPLTELGGAGAIAGLQHARAFVRARPGANVLVVAAELHSLAMIGDEPPAASWVRAHLAGDGAAAALITSRDVPGPRLLGGGTHLFTAGPSRPQQEPELPADEQSLVAALLHGPLPSSERAQLAAATLRLLARAGVRPSGIALALLHPGTPALSAALAEDLSIPASRFATGLEILRDHGHLGGAALLFALARACDSGPKGHGLLGGLGPGPCAELALISWN
jgi:alkylresorcinol/alkylpyrone synthase